ncbi:MAG: alpha-ketoglutarate-dependent dioxygenase AlkB [Gemmatales bacterium]|nr:MAG: alpha-ketoglutarate-dependent dioxygenase AlkB [Gemmatales bacterium]
MTQHPDCQNLDLPDADVRFFPDFFPKPDSDVWFQHLLTKTQWKQEMIKLYGKSHPVPRLIHWYGDEGKTYAYSGIFLQPEPWTPVLLEIKGQVESVVGVKFNSVLCNLYRNERDSVGWHSDDEPELGENPLIASASFGACRTFQMRHKRDKTLRTTIRLTHGSLLVMAGATQHHWLHSIPKLRQPVGPRINLTFRIII